MTHCIRYRFAAFGIALLLLFLSGCMSNRNVLVTPDETEPMPGTDWRTLLFDEMNDPNRGKNTFLRDDDAVAEQMLDCVRSIAEEDAAAAEEKMTENGVNGYAIGAPDIRYALGELDKNSGIADESETCLVGYAIVPQEQAGDVALWDEDMIKQFADRIIEGRCLISLNKDKPRADRVSFAKGKIGEKTFLIAVFR